MNVGSTKVLTLTAYYSTGTILIQGTKCLTWVREEFDTLTLIATVHAIYTIQTTNSSVDMHKDVEDGLCSLRTPAEDPSRFRRSKCKCVSRLLVPF